MTTDQQNARRVFLGMPTYGQQTAQAGCGFWRACADMSQVMNAVQHGSLLASNFNQLWASALNVVHKGGRVDYFAMLHDDIGPIDIGQEIYGPDGLPTETRPHWLDMLIEELEANELDVLGVAVPIKDTRGMTSLALARDDGDNWLPHCRLSMRDVFDLPETFTSADLGHPLLLNTGCWVCKFDFAWAEKVSFTINDRIVFNKAADRYQSQTEPEDWYFSRLLHEMGLKVGATRKIRVTHAGRQDYQNMQPWGTHAFDSEATNISPVPNAFPRDIAGWLHPDEGAKLAELARDKMVLEIGSFCGLSTVCMARTAAFVFAVDYFDGRGTPAPQDTRQAFDANIERYGVVKKVYAMNPEVAVREVTGEVELLFIDGAHDRESVQADIEKYLPLLSADGLIVFHDYNEPCHPGVTEAVDELIATGGEIISLTEHLAVVRPPAAISLEV